MSKISTTHPNFFFLYLYTYPTVSQDPIKTVTLESKGITLSFLSFPGNLKCFHSKAFFSANEIVLDTECDSACIIAAKF